MNWKNWNIFDVTGRRLKCCSLINFDENFKRYYLILLVSLLKTTIPLRHDVAQSQLSKKED